MIDNKPGLVVYPNPFSETTGIIFHIKDPGMVKLEIYDFRGIKIRTLIDQFLTAGDHETDWNISYNPHPGSGIYLLKLTTASGIITRKILVIN